MEQFIIHGGVGNWDEYNCSARTSEEWTIRDGVPHEIEGILTSAWGIIVELMYLPCLWVLSGREFQVYSCFKIMLILGIVDVTEIAINSVITGFLLYKGAVFCTYPTFQYLCGAFAMWFWCTACMLSVLLVVNRLVDLIKPDLAAKVFEGKKTYIIMLFPMIYGLYFFFFTRPVFFQSKYRAWFFDPMIEVGKGEKYNNYQHYVNNIFVVGFTVLLYAYFLIFLKKKIRTELSSGSASARAHKQIFVQSAVICTFTFVASIIYVFFQITEVPGWVIKLGHILWQLDHSCPAFIYLFVNKTIRRAVFDKTGLKNVYAVLTHKNRSSLGTTTPASHSDQHNDLFHSDPNRF